MSTSSMRPYVLAVLSMTPLAGAQQLKLTTGSGGGERQPVISADGSTVAYVAMVAATGRRQVFTVPVDGGAAVQRTTGATVRIGNGVLDAWPSLSISGDGTKITYWNKDGTHVLNTTAGTDTLVATDNTIPYPRIDATGQWVVYQTRVSGQLEVALVAATGMGAPIQITNASGPGRRLPDVQDVGALKILFQKLVNGFNEVFVHDATTSTTTALTSGSGSGNRYARFAHAGGSYIYESTASGNKEVWIGNGNVGGGSPIALTSLGKSGDRLPVLTGDGEAYLQSPGSNLEILRVNDDGTNLVALTSNSSGGLRRVSADRHGHVFVYQSADAGSLEVFQYRLCPEATSTDYGVDGQPSVGQLQGSQDWYRCNLSFHIATSLPGRSASLLIGPQLMFPGYPLPGAPGNFYYVADPVTPLALTLDSNGSGTRTFPIVVGQTTRFYQWAILDPPANALGVVTSRGRQIDF